MKILGIYNAPTLVTMLGLVSGTVACILGLEKESALAIVALIWAGIFDLFDGLVARRSKLNDFEKEFGIQIDSIVDMVSFGIAPVLIAASFGLDWLGYIAVILYACAAAQRLAYFNVHQSEADGKLQFYNGLPVTFSALILGVGLSPTLFLSSAVTSIYISVLMAVLAIAYIAPVRIPKPKGFIYILMPALALVFTGVWLYIGLVRG